jgi:hypothetical protein
VGYVLNTASRNGHKNRGVPVEASESFNGVDICVKYAVSELEARAS